VPALIFRMSDTQSVDQRYSLSLVEDEVSKRSPARLVTGPGVLSNLPYEFDHCCHDKVVRVSNTLPTGC
jgi:hypothetical protein